MSEETSTWYRLIMLVDARLDQEAAALLWEFGVEGVELYDAETFADDGSIEPVPDGTSRLISYLEAPTPLAARAREEAIISGLSGAEILPISVHLSPFTDESWKTSWMDFFRPVRISERTIVGPPWEEFEAPEGGFKITIEPGMAFGTGTHETTQLCGAAIDRLLAARGDEQPPASLLDVGCGSAILGMIARLLGADPVVGVDHDATAIKVAQDNLAANQLSGQIDLSTTPIGAVEGEFDIVVANILTHILLELKEEILARVAPGGALILSGITDTQAAPIREAFVGGEFREVRMDQRGEWVCFELLRDA